MAHRTLTPAYLQTLHRGLNMKFNKELSAQSSAPLLSDKLTVDTSSTGADEEYDWLGDMPILTEIRGEQVKRNLQSRQIIVTNKEFSCLIGLKKATLERDKAGLYGPRLKQVANAARRWFEDRLYSTMVVNGWSTAYPDWTGGAYFASNKKMGKDKQALTFTNAATAALSATAFEAAIQNLMERTDANGKAMNLGAEGFTLVVGPKLLSTAKKIVKAENVAEGGVSVSNIHAGDAELVPWGYLRGDYDDYWFVFARDSARAAFIRQTEVPPASYMCTDPNDSYVMTNSEFLFQIYARGELGPGESLLSYGSTGAG